jgi:hypothetical protein
MGDAYAKGSSSSVKNFSRKNESGFDGLSLIVHFRLSRYAVDEKLPFAYASPIPWEAGSEGLVFHDIYYPPQDWIFEITLPLGLDGQWLAEMAYSP